MKSNIKFSNNNLTIKFQEEPKAHISSRLIELGFKATTNKTFVRTEKLAQNEHDYLQGMFGVQGLGMAYIPAAEKGFILDTTVPDSMGYEMHIAIRKIKNKIGMSLFDYVAEKLDYDSDTLVKSLSAEQIDAVSLAIYNIEKRKQGVIIGDQTGIGKGRTAGAMIRYGVKQGLQPIFLSEKPNLFTDLYRDLVDIDSSELVPFIVNAKASKTNIKDKEGTTVYTAPEKSIQGNIIKSKKVPTSYNFVCATYSQFNNPKKPAKQMFLHKVAENNIIIMDESHNASGSSNTGEFMQSVLRVSKGVVFLSATFAKRPDNMPIYAQKTCMSDANMSKEDLVDAIAYGGVALQEIIASQLVAEGQMIRRERSFEGIEVNYIELKEKAKEQGEVADKVTKIMRDIIKFQEDHINGEIKVLDKIAAGEGKEVITRKGTEKAGVDNVPYFSKVFNVINQLLFSINASDVADHAISRLKEGKKPIIAFASTMGSFLEDIATPEDVINADFSTVLEKGLDSVLRYTEKDIDGESEKKMFNISEMSDEARFDYNSIISEIDQVSTGITISPIDLIVQKINEAGFSTGEVTGRKLNVQYKSTSSKNTTALVMRRKKHNTSDLFRQFNDNDIDCLLINKSGSTGASAHAIVTPKVTTDEVKQRVMIILQPELNISTEIQKRGRINRTGQIKKPIYDYIISSIPAQKRFMMMLKKKLKSLDANTTSNQKNSKSQLKSDDFLNKYGDKVVRLYMLENPELNKLLDNPLKFKGEDSDDKANEGDASKVSGRVAVLPVKEQEKFYTDIIELYNDYVDYLVQADEYDLEVTVLDLKAETKDTQVVIAGKGGKSVFGNDTFLEKCECNVLKKPYKKDELEKIVSKSLNGKNADDISEKIVDTHEQFVDKYLKTKLDEGQKKYAKLLENITNEKAYKLIGNDENNVKEDYIEERTEAIEEAKIEFANKLSLQVQNRKSYLNGFFKYFKVGHGYNYPSLGYDQSSNEGAKCIFLGFDIKEKSKNPYAPSSVKLKFAISDSRKYITLACSGDTAKEIERIQGRSFRLSTEQKETTIDNWEEATKGFTGSRRNRYIVNGNILQGSADFAGKLVSYTTKGRGVKKGILMAESWLPTEENGVGNYVVAPIGKLEKQILSLRSGATMSTENKMTFAKHNYEDKFLIIMPKAKTHQSIFTDKDVIKLLENSRDGFEMISGSMKANVSIEKMPKFLKLLGDRFSVSMKLPKHYFDEHLNSKSKNTSSSDALTDDAIKMLEDDTISFEKRLKKQKQKSLSADKSGSKLKAENSKESDEDMLMLELEAESIIIMQMQGSYKQVAGFTNQRRMF